MAKQEGIIPLVGTIGNITFVRTKDGYQARRKSGVSASKFASDPAFQRTRENGVEFGRAGAAGKLLRAAFRSSIGLIGDKRLVARMQKEMMRVVKADRSNERGNRNVIDGELGLLQGFEFNANGLLGTTLFTPYTATLDRVTGVLKIDIPSFIPSKMITVPQGGTHYRIFSAGADVDFDNKEFVSKTASTEVLQWDNTATAAISLNSAVTPNSTHPLFLVLGIEFFQVVNNTPYPLLNGTFNAVALVKVSAR